MKEQLVIHAVLDGDAALRVGERIEADEAD